MSTVSGIDQNNAKVLETQEMMDTSSNGYLVDYIKTKTRNLSKNNGTLD